MTSIPKEYKPWEFRHQPARRAAEGRRAGCRFPVTGAGPRDPARLVVLITCGNTSNARLRDRSHFRVTAAGARRERALEALGGES